MKPCLYTFMWVKKFLPYSSIALSSFWTRRSSESMPASGVLNWPTVGALLGLFEWWVLFLLDECYLCKFIDWLAVVYCFVWVFTLSFCLISCIYWSKACVSLSCWVSPRFSVNSVFDKFIMESCRPVSRVAAKEGVSKGRSWFYWDWDVMIDWVGTWFIKLPYGADDICSEWNCVPPAFIAIGAALKLL